MDNVYPNGASTLSKVSSCGVDFRLSILAIAGCFTPLNSASSLCEYLFFLSSFNHFSYEFHFKICLSFPQNR